MLSIHKSLRGKVTLLASVSALSMFVLGCNDFEGKIQVNETITLNKVRGSGPGVIPPGVYGVKIDFPEKNKARMEISRRGKDNNPVSYFRIGSRYFPRYNGPINIPSSENGQPYNLVGRMETHTHETAERWVNEYCSVTVSERECVRDYNGEYRCRYVDRIVSGESPVRYYDRITEQYLDLDLEDPVSRRVVAESSGRNSYSERIVTFRGACRTYGHGGGGHYPGHGDDRRDDRPGRGPERPGRQP